MSFISSISGTPPGYGNTLETFEAAFAWGQKVARIYYGGILYSGTVDSTNTPTWELRMGLLLGKITSGAQAGQWTNYSATATDGSEIASGVLTRSMRMENTQGDAQQAFLPIMVGGPIQAAKVIGLDAMARQQMAPHFLFDDNLVGNQYYPALRFVTKAADYTVVAADNGVEFSAITGAVNFTLPTLAAGLSFRFRNLVDATMTVTSAAGNDIVADNDATASSLAFSTGSHKLGGGVLIYSNAAGTAWYSQAISASPANVITVT